MAISGYILSVSTATTLMGSYPSKHPFGFSLSSSSKSQVGFKGLNVGESTSSEAMTNRSCMNLEGSETKCYCNQSFGFNGDNELISESISHEREGLLPIAMGMSFFERLNLALKILFPSTATRIKSNAKIAKQRLKMILFSDRCTVTDDAKQKIMRNIVNTLSDFVEIDSRDKVQLDVSTDSDLGTIYSITIPVRRVKPEYHDEEDLETLAELGTRTSGSHDV